MIRADIEPFTGMFSSLAALSRIHVEVWNESQPVFSSASRPPEICVSGQARDFAARVRRQATFQQAVLGDHQQVFGVFYPDNTASEWVFRPQADTLWGLLMVRLSMDPVPSAMAVLKTRWNDEGLEGIKESVP